MMGAFESLKKAVKGNLATEKAPAVKLAEPPKPTGEWQGVERARQVYRIATDRIVPDPDQPRQIDLADSVWKADVNGLADSIKAEGQLVPAEVRWREDLDRYVVRDGERRYLACRLLGRDLECVIEGGPAPADVDVHFRQYTANEARTPLNAIEKAFFYEQRVADGLSAGEVARRCGIGPGIVSRHRALLKLPEAAQRLVAEGKLSWTKAEALAPLPAARAEDLARRIVAQSLSRERVEQEVDAALGIERPGAVEETPPVAETVRTGQAGPFPGRTPQGPQGAPNSIREPSHRKLPEEWTRKAKLTVTLEDGSPVEVTYLPGKIAEGGEANLTFVGPINPTGKSRWAVWNWQVNSRMTVAGHAQEVARKEHDDFRRRLEREKVREKERLECARYSAGNVAGWDGPLNHNFSDDAFRYSEPDPAAPEDDELVDIELCVTGKGDWPPAIAALERALAAARWRHQLFLVQPYGALPGDLVELIDAEHRLFGRKGVILDEVGDTLRVRFDDVHPEGRAEICVASGEHYRRLGPGPASGISKGGQA
jgi:ParB/RepB/Spo0J family partition protein